MDSMNKHKGSVMHQATSGRVTSVMVRLMVLLMVYGAMVHSIEPDDVQTMDFLMPEIIPTQDDAYMCYTTDVPTSEDIYIINFEALASGQVAHHILLYGCAEADFTSEAESCSEPCESGEAILYAWARNAPPTHMPEDVGFKVGGDSTIRYLVLQIHYSHAFPDGASGDTSGVRITYTEQRQKYLAGVLLIVASEGMIPSRTAQSAMDVSCTFNEPVEIHPFAFRVHAHSLGKVISGYMYNDSWYLLGKGNPQWPQAFYPIDEKLVVKQNDVLAARCVFNSTARRRLTYIGSTGSDEMCNFYMMYYTEHGKSFYLCEDSHQSTLMSTLPQDSYVPLPPNALLDDIAAGHIHHTHTEDDIEGHSEGQGESERQSQYISESQSRASESRESEGRDIDGGLEGLGRDYTTKGGTRDSEWDESSSTPVGEEMEDVSDMDEYTDNLETRDYRDPEYDGYNYDLHDDPDDMYYDVLNQRSRNRRPPPEGRSGARGSQHQQPIREQYTSTNDKASTNRQSSVGSSSANVDVSTDVPASKITEDENWAQVDTDLGQVAGVAVDTDDNLHLFHRGSREWGASSFGINHVFSEVDEGPIPEDTLLTLDENGEVIRQWGSDMFYMPHGLHIDHQDNIWLTDVALHQVMRFPSGKQEADLVLGEKLVPGHDLAHFCQPTDVAVMTSGEFFVSDGYCNSRVIKYSSSGSVLLHWGEPSTSVTRDGFPPPSTFDLPHSLALMEDMGWLCVVDRENARLQIFTLNGTFVKQIHPALIEGKLYAATYSQPNGVLYVINGGDHYHSHVSVRGHTINVHTGEVANTWAPHQQNMSRPHDVAVDLKGQHIYVGEIGPNTLWRFSVEGSTTQASLSLTITDRHQSVKKASLDFPSVQHDSVHPGSIDRSDATDAEQEIERQNDEEAGDFGVSLIIGALLVVPVMLVIIVTLILRARKKGKLQFLFGQKTQNRRFNLGNFFGRHRGFDPIHTDSDPELDHLNSDSEVDEFNAPTHLKA